MSVRATVMSSAVILRERSVIDLEQGGRLCSSVEALGT